MPVPLARLCVGPWADGSCLMNCVAPAAFPAFSAAVTSFRFSTPTVAMIFRSVDRYLARSTWVHLPLRIAAASLVPKTSREHRVPALVMASVPDAPFLENFAGKSLWTVSGAGSWLRLSMCFHGPRVGGGLLCVAVG